MHRCWPVVWVCNFFFFRFGLVWFGLPGIVVTPPPPFLLLLLNVQFGISSSLLRSTPHSGAQAQAAQVAMIQQQQAAAMLAAQQQRQQAAAIAAAQQQQAMYLQAQQAQVGNPVAMGVGGWRFIDSESGQPRRKKGGF